MSKKTRTERQKQLADIAVDFDVNLYLLNYPEVRLLGVDPKLHYLRKGWKEGKAPNAWFDGDLYLTLHSDVAESGINPWLHYVRFGRDEGRIFSRLASPDRPHHAERKIIEGAISAREAAAHYGVPPAPDAIGAEALVALIVGASPRGVVLSFSHDNYALNYGGIQRLIGSEAANFVATGWYYLHLAPAKPLPILSDDSDFSTFSYLLTINGEAGRSILASDLLSAGVQLKEKSISLELIVHQLMGHSPEIIRKICADLNIAVPYVWIHDFYTLCESFNLLRNDWKFCGAPRVDSIGCRVCVHGAGRPAHFDRMRAFFGTLQPVVLAPSQSALNVWRGRGLAFRESHVVPIGHIVYSEIPQAKPIRTTLRVAFVGQSLHAKGWTTFRKLVARFRHVDNLEFFHFGTQSGEAAADPSIRFIPVRADHADRDATSRLLAINSIDIVLIWSAWPESFCYAAHEAVVAGTVVITNSHAGNVPSVLASQVPERSAVLDTEDELFALFESRDRLEKLCANPIKQGVLLPFENSVHVILRRRVVDSHSHVQIAGALAQQGGVR